MGDLAERIAALPRPEAAPLKPAAAMRLAREIRAAGTDAGLQPLRVAVLSSYSFEFAEPYLVLEGARRGLAVESHYGPFGQLEQALLPASDALAFDPAVWVIAWRIEDVDPDAVVRFHASDGQRFGAVADALIARIGAAVDALRARSAAPVLVANFAAPADLPLGVFDANLETALTPALADANQRLQAALAVRGEAVVWDYAGLLRSRGAAAWTDPRLEALARAPVAAAHQPVLAAHLLRSANALLRPPAKVLVLDLDNTLWGGVVGDDGLEGLQLGDDHPGVAFRRFQRAVLALRDRGVLLAVASKNEPETALRVFDAHPEMLIRRDDLAAFRIGWGPKSQSLLEIAGELKLGADALVFFDDNPVERAEVRAHAPAVRVVEVPTDPLRYEAALAACEHFDTPSLTGEDRGRTELYRQERERRALATESASLEDFLAGLGMRAQVGRLGPPTLQRIAQLVGKTNQFNLTTRRHGRAELERMAASPDHVVAWLRLADRYGDAGLVAVGVLAREGDAAVIDTFLMSCRVMGRQVEHAFAAYLGDAARALDCARLVGEYLPTPKNGVVSALYPELGFASAGSLPDGGARFERALADGGPAWPASIAREDERAPDDPADSA